MTYQVIARKWRPQFFEEVIGQEAVTQTLRNAIEHGRLHHAYIFSGARGVGKTTSARLLAKALNCHKTEKANPKPCDTNSDNACPSCIEISESRSLDVLEFDAASNTQVDKIREIIIENIQISSARDRYKVFIIDEVHMLSKSSFNALLKTLEEPPENVVFVMATTELHKVPDTILSRVQEFEFRTIPLQKILGRLKTIAEAENINITDAGLKEIARSGEGSMRDAQSHFDQVISFSGEKIDTEDVIKALGIASAENLTKTIQAISEKDSKEILKVVDDLIARGQDLRHFCTDLLSFIRDLLVFKMAGDAKNLLDTAVLSFEELGKHSEPYSESDLIRLFNSLAETESKLREANEPRFILEVGLLKLIEMNRVKPIEKLLERLTKLEKALGNIDTSKENEKSSIEKEVFEEKKTPAIIDPPKDTPFPTNTEKISSDSKVKVVEQINFNNNNPQVIENIDSLENSIEDFPQKDVLEDKIDNLPNKKSPIINVDSMPVKLEPIDSEELEHIEDKWLDKAFEYKLLHEGDDLKIIKNADEIIQVLLNQNNDSQIKAEIEISSQTNGSAIATAPVKENKALNIVSEMQKYEEIDEAVPDLPENPTEEELFNYAQNHPTVKKVIRIFRGKLVNVIKKQEE